MKRFLAVFDFDQTLTEQDSDRWVFQELNPSILENVTTLICNFMNLVDFKTL